MPATDLKLIQVCITQFQLTITMLIVADIVQLPGPKH